MMPDGCRMDAGRIDGWMNGWMQEPLVYYQLTHKLNAQVY